MEPITKEKVSEDTETVFDQKVNEALLRRLSLLLSKYKISELTELNSWLEGKIEFRIKLEER